MSIDDKYILDIGRLVFLCKKVIENDWDFLSVVYDINDGQISNTGFLYLGDKIRPVTTKIESNPLLLGDKILEFREVMHKESGHKFKQLLIQMEKETGRIKIDFEFDDPNRWTIKPAKIKEMREALRPEFS